ncbi:hypothetical protein F3Y22_tig00116970pilonHSYRG00016 [Hibiscus syriacus]|uniref:Kinesin motor domain-containing protein n=1 Tax=Hibiscus syriacus TaxID=106335 RepID=A0A6A2WHU8_HIBSY|nr:hypothetical protein F3Y22_tig00116970pilonHSYRG00016 [Hibiscus syriacus]
MDNSESVRVAVNIRPLITTELPNGCTDCITVVPGEPQVQIGSHVFTYDYVYGGAGSPSSALYDDCVAPLVDALFHGYNATVLAYGQTGSGKTYTMGTNYTGEGSNGGIIPKVMKNMFKRVEATKHCTEILIRVSFIEIFNEEVFDLLESNSAALSKVEATSLAKQTAPGRLPIQIRETVNGGITLAGVTEAAVRTKEEMASYLSRGSSSRATGSTNMNSQSSRSHAIFTITMEQKKIVSCPNGVDDDIGGDILCAKLHLVDLAGSERAKRTGADGMRFKEGIHINKGLLALGNVISALGDDRKRKEGGHVPYRDSKLTRLLQTSCVSPADTNAEETLNTLKYANRARNIQNKAVINRDPMAAQLQRMRSQIEQLQAELLFCRGDGQASFDELKILKHKVTLLEASNAELQQELQERRLTSEQLAQRALDAQVEKDKLIMQIESVRNGKSWDEIASNQNQDFDLMKTYVSKIQELEGELVRLKSMNSTKCGRFSDCVDSGDDGTSKNSLFSSESADLSDEIEDNEVNEAELEHSSIQQKLDRELKELEKRLEQKEAEMKRFANSDTSVLKQHYEKKVNELEHEKRALQKEIENLRHNLANISSTSDDGAQKLKEEYLQKLNALEAQVADLKKKQDAQAQLLRLKQKSNEAARRLQDEIHRIKSQKVNLQLKKEGRRNEFEMHKLLALNQRQKMVLQRKTEEAAMATKRLKELLESRKASSREASSAGIGNGPGVQAIMQTIDHELEVTVRVHEVRSEYERQMEERAKMAKEVARLKEESEILKRGDLRNYPETLSPGARNSRIFALENMLAATSSTLVTMASQLSEAEERERIFSGKGRWNHVRCSLRDKEALCREKDEEIRDLKEKVVKVSSLARQLEAQKVDLVHQLKVKNVTAKHSMKETMESGILDFNGGRHKYELRNTEHRSSTIFTEDMDISESEHSDMEAHDDDNDDEWVQSDKKQIWNKVYRSRTSILAVHQPDTNVLENKECSVEVTEKIDGMCCTCSKQSSCKTSRCQCRENGSSCGQSCGCSSVRCSNREAEANVANDGDSNETNNLVAHGAFLLQNAFCGEKPAETNDDCPTKRKALSDIGNTVAKPDAPRHNRRKKWGKSMIQLVPVATPDNAAAAAPEKPETREPLKIADNLCPSESDTIPLKLPRAMRSNGSKLLRERNVDQQDESNKEAAALAPTSSEEKENRHC